jgi:hypothetical protein
VNITIDAAADKLRLSARPAMGIVTSVIPDPKEDASTPLASLPKIAMQSPEIDRSRIELFARDESRNFSIPGNCLSTRSKEIPS